MVSGIEAIGLALAIFPLVTEVIHVYSGAFSGHEYRLLSESLKNHEQIFLNSVESLLRSIVSPDKLRELLDDKTGVAWKDADLNTRMIKLLGQESSGLLDLANDILQNMTRLQKKLPVLSPGESADQSRRARAKLVIKAFVRGPKNKASLDSLTSQIKEFRMLTDDSLRLAPARQGPTRKIANLSVVQDGATTLYKTLRDGLQCECEEPHPAHMRLEIWSPEEREDTVCLKFSFLFAENAEAAQEDHWRIAEIVPERSNKSTTSSGTSPINQGSFSRTQSRVRFHLPQPIVASPTQIDPNSDHDELANLCCELTGRLSKTLPKTRQRIGSMSSSDGSEYGLFTTIDLTNSKVQSSKALTDILSSSKLNVQGPPDTTSSPKSKLSPKQRVRLSLLLAWAVLQLSQTNWLEGHWTKENILLVMNPSNIPQPYISHHFVSSRHKTGNVPTMPTAQHECESWVRNEALFALAVFLLEMCYHRPMEELATDKEKSVFPYLTAVRLAKDVESEMGVQYAQAVNACLHPTLDFDSKSSDQDARKLAHSVLKHIIGPLELVAASFGYTVPIV